MRFALQAMFRFNQFNINTPVVNHPRRNLLNTAIEAIRTKNKLSGRLPGARKSTIPA